MPITAWTTCI